jgi:hypothetical protein
MESSFPYAGQGRTGVGTVYRPDDGLCRWTFDGNRVAQRGDEQVPDGPGLDADVAGG